MTNEEILKKAIEKATKNGFRWSQLYDDKMIREYHEEKEQGKDYKVLTRFRTVGVISWKVAIQYKTMLGMIAQGYFKVNDFIFSHDFAKAFWGEESICKDGSNWEDYLKGCLAGGMSREEAVIDWEIDKDCFRIPYWQYHLQRMVLEKEPLKYLEGFL